MACSLRLVERLAWEVEAADTIHLGVLQHNLQVEGVQEEDRGWLVPALGWVLDDSDLTLLHLSSGTYRLQRRWLNSDCRFYVFVAAPVSSPLVPPPPPPRSVDVESHDDRHCAS